MAVCWRDWRDKTTDACYIRLLGDKAIGKPSHPPAFDICNRPVSSLPSQAAVETLKVCNRYSKPVVIVHLYGDCALITEVGVDVVVAAVVGIK